ncbi:hypothetical protein [Photobacterium gaetbulicola]|uniref:hypothetical protein n=1 Tax=Photobacterium gaetbulicola TaxID=1295392 RepID=UPI0012DFF832|nr:hypothetical protein [Photobacterium gaetbulicola]
MKPIAMHDALVQLSLVNVCDIAATIHPKDRPLNTSPHLERRKKRISQRRSQRTLSSGV